MEYTLHDYQERATKFGIVNKRVLYWMCRGSGKTLVAIDIIQKVKQYPILVVTPLSVRTQFEKEINKFHKQKVPLIQLLTSRDDVDINAGIVIVNPDILKKKSAQLKSNKFKVAIIDESHYMKSRRAQRTKTIISICEDIEFKYCLTGSAITQAPIDLFTQFQILCPEKFGNKTSKYPNRMTWFEFAVRYSGGKQGRFGFEAKKATNTEELRRRCKNLVFRVTHGEALLAIPSINEIDWDVEVRSSQRKIMDQMQKDFTGWLRSQGLTEYDIYRKMNAEALVKLNEMRKIVSAEKSLVAVELARDITLEGNKVIVFCAFQSAVDNLVDKLKGAVTITGNDNEKTKAENVERFKNDDKCMYLICNIKAGGVGLNLQNAHNIIFVDLPFNYSDYDQAVGRCHRHGQKEHTNIYKLMCAGTVDSKINKYILHKKDFEKVL